jgi:hypothetical protein
MVAGEGRNQVEELLGGLVNGNEEENRFIRESSDSPLSIVFLDQDQQWKRNIEG